MNFSNLYYVSSWKSKGLSNESLKPPTTFDNSLTPILDYYDGSKIKVSFDRGCLKKDKVIFNHGKIVHICILYEIIRIANINGGRDSNLTVENCLFGTVTLTFITISILVMELDLIEDQAFHFKMVDMVKI